VFLACPLIHSSKEMEDIIDDRRDINILREAILTA